MLLVNVANRHPLDHLGRDDPVTEQGPEQGSYDPNVHRRENDVDDGSCSDQHALDRIIALAGIEESRHCKDLKCHGATEQLQVPSTFLSSVFVTNDQEEPQLEPTYSSFPPGSRVD